MSSLSDSSDLLQRVRRHDESAISKLLLRYRDRLHKMASIHLDDRLLNRVDASDMVQEALLNVSVRLPAFASDPNVPTYVWLRQIVRDRLSELYERHLKTQKRSVLKERHWGLSNDSMTLLTGCLETRWGAVIDGVIREETRQILRRSLSKLAVQRREVLVIRHLEQMTISEIAAASGLSEGAVKMRQLRRVEKLRQLLRDKLPLSSSH